VAGAIQDHDRGLIVGETTFGKGLVQTVYPLSENTGLALTTAKYYTPSGRLIQREYNGVSLYDYYYNSRDSGDGTPPAPGREVKMTDSGRTVYGGGGINPDIVIAPIKGNKFEDTLLQKYAFFNFAKHYVINHKVAQSFQVDDAVMQEFRKFLDSQQIPFTEAELAENSDWVRSNIKAELFVNEFGQQEGLKVHTETDPAVEKALELLPKAKELADTAKKTIAQRSNARLTAQQESAPAAATDSR
jgi:carboxyl-terminal processing protease